MGAALDCADLSALSGSRRLVAGRWGVACGPGPVPAEGDGVRLRIENCPWDPAKESKSQVRACVQKHGQPGAFPRSQAAWERRKKGRRDIAQARPDVGGRLGDIRRAFRDVGEGFSDVTERLSSFGKRRAVGWERVASISERLADETGGFSDVGR
jgi:hypothetical protein